MDVPFWVAVPDYGGIACQSFEYILDAPGHPHAFLSEDELSVYIATRHLSQGITEYLQYYSIPTEDCPTPERLYITIPLLV